MLVPLVWSGGTRRPHIGLGPQINFHPHFRSKIGIVKKHPENFLLAPNHVAGAYKHHGTLKLCSEALTSLLQGGFWSFMRQNSCGAARSWILGGNGFLWSCKVKLHILVAFGAVSQFRRILPEVAGSGANRIPT